MFFNIYERGGKGTRPIKNRRKKVTPSLREKPKKKAIKRLSLRKKKSNQKGGKRSL